MSLLYNKKSIQILKNTTENKELCLAYNKFYARTDLGNKNTLVDNGNYCSVFFINAKVGNSLKLSKVLFSNQFNKKFKFVWLNKKQINTTITDCFFQTLTSKTNHIVILHPIRGGFKVYTNGVFGIIFYNFFKEIVPLLKQSKRKISKYCLANRYNIIRNRAEVKKLFLYPHFPKNNFKKNRKNTKSFTSANIIFKSYEAIKQKKPKKVRKYYFKKKN